MRDIKRRRTSQDIASAHRIDELPDVVLIEVAKYLSVPSRVLLAVAMAFHPSHPPSSSSRRPATVTEKTRAILTASLETTEREGQDNNPWEVLDFIEFEKKSLVTKHKVCTHDYAYEYEETHYGEVGNECCKQLTDEDVFQILTIIDAVNNVKTLKLAGCVNIVGRGLEPLRGSAVLKHLDLSFVGPHESPLLTPPPLLSEHLTISILDSIIAVDHSSLEYVCFPKAWREKRSSTLTQFIGRYNHHLESSSIKCCRYAEGMYGCGNYCQDTDAGGRKPWVIQNTRDFPHMSDKNVMETYGVTSPDPVNFFLKRWGIQRFTCHKCFKHTCNICTDGADNVEEGGGHYVVQNLCVKCEKHFCAPCSCPEKTCKLCQDVICDECRRSEGGDLLVKCDCGRGRLCANCYTTCECCNKSGCGYQDCLTINKCEGNDCDKTHCVNCFDDQGHTVQYCDCCNKSYCSDCRYSSCSKGWSESCTACMDTLNVCIPIHNRSAYSFYSESVRDEVIAANRRYISQRGPYESHGIGQILIKQYKALSDEERASWHERAANDVHRYQTEMGEFQKIHGSVSCQSPCFMYANSVRSHVKTTNPSSRSKDIDNRCSGRFTALPNEEIDYWEQQSTAEYLRSTVQKNELPH